MGIARWIFCIHLCRNHLLWAIAAGILLKTQPCNTFSRVSTAKCTSSCNHDGSLKDNYCVPFLKLKFFIPTLRHIFCLPKPLKVYGESYFGSSVSWNTLGKCTILWFKKRDLFLMGRKYKWILSKIVTFFSSGYYFPSYVSPLNMFSKVPRGQIKRVINFALSLHDIWWIEMLFSLV